MVRTNTVDPADAVIILRTGYATDTLWHEALATALGYKRAVIAVDADGHRVDAEQVLAESW